ncbi:hypothetical protein ABW21_db0208498 [Orbilia brochopaga]|nr:hypothetical protein ABW21_db0208498 [Drechslerella brochopaga]
MGIGFLEECSSVRSPLGVWSPEDFLTVGVEAGTPKLHTRHQLLSALEFAILAEHGVNELFARLLAHGDAWGTLAHGGSFGVLHRLGTSPHVLLAVLEETLHAVPETVARLKEIVDQDEVISSLDAVALDDFSGALALAAQLDEKQPELTGLFGDTRARSVSEHGPVVDPLP